MAKRSAVEQIVIEEKTVSDAILKLISSKEKASAWHLKWAKFEEDEYLIFLFTKLSEMRWIWNESLRQFSEKHLEYTKTFKEIYHKERVIEETKKAFQACETNTTKLKKQIESASKKGDSVKLHMLDKEFESKQVMMEHLQKKIDSETGNLLGFKIEQIQKGLKMEAQAALQLADQMRQVYVTQRRVADILASATLDNSAGTWQMITQSIIGLSDTLKMYPPPSGAVDPLPSPSESPYQGKKSTHESPIHSPQGNMASTYNPSTGGRRSFPFTFRPLPQEPVDNHHEYRSHSPTGGGGGGTTPVHNAAGTGRTKFTRTSSDVTPVSVNSLTLPYKHKTSVTIFEENHLEGVPRSRSASQSYNTTQPKSNGSGGIGIDLSPLRSQSQDHISMSSQDDISNKSSRATSDQDITGGADSESGYADPIDALRKYHESVTNNDTSDMTSLDAPYKSVMEVQKIRRAQMNKIQVSSYDEDPTYSRPYDCLVGLPNPVKVRGEPGPPRRMISPLAVQRHSTPDFPISLDHHPTVTARRRTRSTRKHQPQQPPRSMSTSDDDLSSSLSPSPEPHYSPHGDRRQSNLSFDIGDEDDEDTHILLADEPHEILKSHIDGGGDILSMNSLDLLSSPVESSQHSPVHEGDRLYNGYSNKMVYPLSVTDHSSISR